MTELTPLLDPMTGLTRRRFIAAIAASGALAACSGSDGAEEFTLVQRFPNNVQVPGEVRMPITLSTGAAEFIQDGPDTLSARLVDNAGEDVGDSFTAVKRTVAPAPYYDFRTTIDVPGFYSLIVEGGPSGGAAVQVLDLASVAVPTPGTQLPPFETPTTIDPQGFTTVCTRTPEPCPFHAMTLTEALAAGKPVAYYVGTPAFCSTGSCAPALDALVNALDQFGDAFSFVHAEVFSDDAGTVVAPAVDAVGMTYEPALFITDADGIVVERLDAVWDQTELIERLTLHS